MKQIGVFVLIIGICIGGYAIFMDTSVSAGYFTERVNNIGLMNSKTNFIAIGGILCIIGTILFAVGEASDDTKALLQKQVDSNLAQIALLKVMLTKQGADPVEIDNIAEKAKHYQNFKE